MGLPSDSEWYITKSDLVVFALMIPFACCSSFGSAAMLVVSAIGRSTVQSPVRLSLGPVRTIWSVELVMVTFAFVKVALQLLSHSCPIDKRFPVFNSGKTRAWLASFDTCGIANVAASVDMRDCPLGHPTLRRLAGCVVIPDDCMMYVPLAPESG